MDTSQLVNILEKDLLREEAKKQLLMCIRNFPELEVFDNSFLNIGDGGGCRVTYDMLAEWLLDTSTKCGSKETVGHLQKFLELDATPGYYILALSGLNVNKSVKISDSINLIPFENIPDYDVKHFYESMIQMQKFEPPQLPQAAIVNSVKISPKTFKGMEIPAPISGISEILHQISDCLTLIGSCAPKAVAEWAWFEDWVPCVSPLMARILPSTSFESLRNSTPYTFTDSDCSEAADIGSKYLNLTPNIKQVIRISLQRLNQSRRRSNLVDKAIDLGISLEVILLHDRSVDDPISFPFRLRGAWLLGKDAIEREKHLKLLREIYNCRCIAVHSGRFDKKSTKKLSLPVDEVIKEGDELCVNIIKSILQDKRFPDWDKLILGGLFSIVQEN